MIINANAASILLAKAQNTMSSEAMVWVSIHPAWEASKMRNKALVCKINHVTAALVLSSIKGINEIPVIQIMITDTVPPVTMIK